MDFKKFQERLLLIRKKKNLSQADMAKRMGISQGAYSFYEKNSFIPSIKTVARLAKTLEVPLDYLTGNSNFELNNDIIGSMRKISKMSKEDRKQFLVEVNSLIREIKNNKKP